MDTADGSTREQPQKLGRFVPWLTILLLSAVALAWVAARIEREFAPVLVFPLLVGGVLGGAAAGLARRAGLPARGFGMAGVLLCGIVVVAAGHVRAWRQWQQMLIAATNRARESSLSRTAAPPAAVPRPAPAPGLWEFLKAEAADGRPWVGGRWRGAWAWCSWGIDAVLLVGAALLVYWQLQRSTIILRPKT